jgi:hypothetical protein
MPETSGASTYRLVAAALLVVLLSMGAFQLAGVIRL